MRRPLYGAALILFLFCLILPSSLWMHTGIPEGMVEFTGTVGRREEQNHMQVLYLKDTGISKTGWILVYLNESNRQYFIGNKLSVYGKLTNYENAGNPGQFDSRVYYETRKIHGYCYGEQVKVLDAKVNRPLEWMYQQRLRLGLALGRWMDPKDAAVMKAMVLGDRRDIPEDVEMLYKLSGISHLLAISGLHISIMGTGLYKCLRRAGIHYCPAGLAAIFLMVGYGMMIGAGISTLRALMMFLLMIGAEILGRSYDMRTALAASAIWMLFHQPLYAKDSSFLLSFGAVFGLTEVTPVLCGSFRKNRMKQGLMASLGVQTVTLPVLMNCFYEVSLYGPLLNLIVLPLTPFILVSGILCAGVGYLQQWKLCSGFVHRVFGFFCKGAGWGCGKLLGIVEWLAGRGCSLPGNQWVTGAPESWQIAGYYLCLGMILLFLWIYRWGGKREGKERELPGKGVIILCLIYAVGFLGLSIRIRPEFSMTMLDVGQGDGIYFETRGGSNFLVDGGSTDTKQVGKYCLVPFLKYCGRKGVDYVLVSHGDEDHISGIREILEGELVEIKCLILPRSGGSDESCLELAQLAKGRGCRVLWMKAGDCLEDGKLRISCISPRSGAAYESENAGSLVLSLRYENLKILLTGDLEGRAEAEILASGLPEATYDILKVAHHGSSNATGEAFLDAVNPGVSLISCGVENSYGHPHPELLERLRAVGSKVYTTPNAGAVIVTSNGRMIRVRTWVNREVSDNR